MLSKNKIKFINSLKLKKYRNANKLFICEGIKIFETLVESEYEIEEVFGTLNFIENTGFKYPTIEITEVSVSELKKISMLTTSQEVLALVRVKDFHLATSDLKSKLTIVLDSVQDPGNLGTIIRLADWFGIENVICSEGTVDVFNSKVVQATMGAIFSVRVHYINVLSFLSSAKEQNIPIYGTFMNGENIYETQLSPFGVIIMGNEANGISDSVKEFVTQKLTIPFYNSNKKSESLNVAVSASIVVSEFKRQITN